MTQLKAPQNYNVLRGTVSFETAMVQTRTTVKCLISLAITANILSCTNTTSNIETSFEKHDVMAASACRWSLTTFIPLKSHRTADLGSHSHKRGAILLVPGLNNSATAMTELAEVLYSKGFHVEQLQLPGQGATPCTFEPVADAWISSITEATETLTKKYPNSPIYQIGYSLGGALIANYLLNQENQQQIAKAVLIAPAINLTGKTEMVRILLWLRHLGIPLPSLAPPDIRADSTVPLKNYKATLEVADRLKAQENRVLSNTTQVLVVISSTDTLVSPVDTAAWTSTGSVEQWKFHEIRQKGGCWSQEGHFLPFPKHSEAFQELADEASEFLAEG